MTCIVELQATEDSQINNHCGYHIDDITLIIHGEFEVSVKPSLL